MKKTVTWISMLAMALGLTLPAFAAEGKTETVTGYVTDSHCNKKGAAKEHTAECVDTCLKGGAKAQIMSEDGKTYDLDSAGWAKVKGLMGGKVTIKGTVDEKTNTIKVASAEKAEKAP